MKFKEGINKVTKLSSTIIGTLMLILCLAAKAETMPNTFLYNKYLNKSNVEVLYASAYDLYYDAEYNKAMDFTSTDYRRNPFIVIDLPETGAVNVSTAAVMENKDIYSVVESVQKKIQTILTEVSENPGVCNYLIQSPPADTYDQSLRGTLYYLCMSTPARLVSSEFIRMNGDEAQNLIASVVQTFSSIFEWKYTYAQAVNSLMQEYGFPDKTVKIDDSTSVSTYSIFSTFILWKTQPKLYGKFVIYYDPVYRKSILVYISNKDSAKLGPDTVYNKVTKKDIVKYIKKYKRYFDTNDTKKIKEIYNLFSMSVYGKLVY